jgi:hypothetical protein
VTRTRVVATGGRLLVAAVVVTYFCILLAVGGYQQWDKLGVPARGTPTFLDLRSVTSAWECRTHGLAVLPMNPCDPLRRPANYPRIWTLPGEFGAGQGATTVLGWIIGVVFLVAAVLALPPDAGISEALVYAAVVCSPAAMLGIQRGNVDLLLFVLVCLALFLLRRSREGTFRAHWLILLAALLKLFPGLAAGALLRLRPLRVRLLAACAAVFVVYALLSLHELRTIARVTPQINGYSYGVHMLGGWLATSSLGVPWRVCDLLLIVVALVGGSVAAGQLRPGDGAADPRVADAFVAGSGIYVLTYLVARSFDYRLVFLLLTVPQLVRWARARSWPAVIGIVALLASTWLGTPWGGVPAIYYRIIRLQGWISLHGSFAGRLPLEAIPQFVLCLALVAGVVALVRPTRVASPVQLEPTVP